MSAPLTAVHCEMRGRYTDGCAGNGIGKPVNVIMQPRVHRRRGDTVPQYAPDPPIIIVAGLRQNRANGKCSARVQRRERAAAGSPAVDEGRFVRSLAAGGEFE